MSRSPGPTRRDVLAGLGALAVTGCSRDRTSPAAPAAGRPQAPMAVQSGDVDRGRALVWAKAGTAGKLLVEWRRAGDRDDQARRVVGPRLDTGSDLCGAVELTDLPAGDIVYAAFIEDDRGRRSDPTPGRLRVRGDGEPLLLAWSGDVCGQGWGIDTARGGMTAFAAMRALAPDLFIHSGDAIYADGPLVETVPLPRGEVWRNLMTPTKAHVAETQADYWGAFAYNLLDEHYRGFLAEVAMVGQWDDHETINNWYPGQLLGDDRYAERAVDVLAARARKAFADYTPIRGSKIHRVVRPHPDVEIIVLDARTFRGANGAGREPQAGATTAHLGADQVRWLVDALAASTATWKLIACDQPLALELPDGDPIVLAGSLDGALVQMYEGFAQGAGPPLGREHEIATILRTVKERAVRNVVWLTADVHYAASHHFHPERATFTDFDPFWELIAGPLHAGVFGPNALDPTFGPEIVFARTPPEHLYGSGPWGGLMSFGSLRYDPRSRALAVTQHGGDGAVLWETELAP